jgi:hypothetical protein
MVPLGGHFSSHLGPDHLHRGVDASEHLLPGPFRANDPWLI